MLTGFVTLAIYGMLYRMWPAMAKSPVARMQFWVSSLGAAGIIIELFLCDIRQRATGGNILDRFHRRRCADGLAVHREGARHLSQFVPVNRLAGEGVVEGHVPSGNRPQWGRRTQLILPVSNCDTSASVRVGV